MNKTNVMRILDSYEIAYNYHQYDENITDGQIVAKLLKEDPEQCFKTLVTKSNTNDYYVFVIPVNHKLNLKKAAKASVSKSIELIPLKDLLKTTGYIHGGCSPIGMKKQFRTFINDTALLFDKIMVSAGKVGLQIELNPSDINKLMEVNYLDLVD